MSIKLFVMDVDGTLTDGRIYIGNDGELMKAFSIKDGAGIVKLFHVGIIPVIITGRKSRIVEKRARELKIEELYQSVENKQRIIDFLLEKYKIQYDQIAYIGDDENDLDAIRICGISACPADACEAVKAAAHHVLTRNGGYGAVREFIDMLI